jgi:diaminopimelate epimerase
MPSVPFVKASACGNDFLLIEGQFAPSEIGEFTRRICDRHDGVGADGVEWMFPHATADVELRLINADGSEAEISGNGTRCVAAFLCAERKKEKTTIQTGAGLKTCMLTATKEPEYEFEIAMGEAVVEKEVAIPISPGEVRGFPVSMGNPHFVVFGQEFSTGWQKTGAEIQRSSEFRQGVNVEFVVVDSLHQVTARFFERGVGETRSSGTGSCASASAAIATGRAQSPVQVHAPGGTQTVRQDGAQTFLRGWARLVCRGEFIPGEV